MQRGDPWLVNGKDKKRLPRRTALFLFDFQSSVFSLQSSGVGAISGAGAITRSMSGAVSRSVSTVSSAVSSAVASFSGTVSISAPGQGE